MIDGAELPCVPASDAPAEHHAAFFAHVIHIVGLIVHDGIRIVESPAVLALLPPNLRTIATVVAVADTVIVGAALPPAAATVVLPVSTDPSTPAGA